MMLMPLMASASTYINGIYYNLNSTTKVAEVTSVPSGYGKYMGSIVIPETLSYGGVIYLVKSIGAGAFGVCSNLTSIVIPNSVTSIGRAAFSSCSSLTTIEIPNGVTNIEACTFQNCSNLTSVVIPSSVKTIEEWAFAFCNNLISIEIPSSVISIGNVAFARSSLTSVEIPKSVTNIGQGAFGNCSSLTSIKVEQGNPVYDSREECNAIIETEINELIAGCKNTIIPNGVKSIGGYVFENCTGLTTIEIPSSLISIGEEAFSGCSSLTSVKISDMAAWCKINFVNTTSNPLSYAKHLYLNEKEVKDLVIPDDVTSIGNYAFYNDSLLSSIVIPNSVMSIGTRAFAQCPEIKEVYCYAKDVPTLSSDAFQNSYYIKWATLYVPNASIDLYKASKWSQFGAIEPLTNGIPFVDSTIESLCLANWDTDKDGKLYKYEAAAVTDLGFVFKNNTDIMFFDELKFFTGLTNIGDDAFYYCSKLTSITIPDNVTTIGNRSFYVCSNLKSLHVPANVTTIEDRAFAYCSGLETIEVDENNLYYDSRNKCNALIQTNTNTLLVGCKNSVIPNSVNTIAEGAFRGCTELMNIVIPEGVKTIGASAFRGCTGLISVSLPSTITSIGNYAFSAFDEVYNLATVRVGMTSPVAIASEVFPNRANSILYVPKGSQPAYKAADYWKEFKQIVELENGVPLKCEKPIITLLANSKIKVESATEGATCVTNITASNAEPLTDREISINTPLVVYTVTSYATKEGYNDSEVATATFRYEKSEGDMNGDGNLNITDVIHLVNMILGQ